MVERDQVLALIKGETKEVISWTMGFFDEQLAKELLGEECIPSDILPSFEFCHGSSPRQDWEAKALFAERARIPAVPVGWGNCLAFGHGGPGEFSEKAISISPKRRITVYETGVHKEVRYDPHFYHNYDYPLQDLTSLAQDLDSLLPNPNDPLRYKGLDEEIAYHKERRRMTYTNLNGFFSGVHYFLYPYDKLLMDLLLEPQATKRLVDTLAEYNLTVAEHLLRAGVDILCFCDDLGSDQSLLISPELYGRYFRRYHGELARLCKSYGAVLHMHSHGNINPIMDDLYDLGIDMLNPVDPTESMDLGELAERYGDRITFVGGINKFFFDWEEAEQREYLEKLYSSVTAGFFLMDSGGIPECVDRAEWQRFNQMKDELAAKYGR